MPQWQHCRSRTFLGFGIVIAIVLVMPMWVVAADTTTNPLTPPILGATGDITAAVNTPVTFSGNGFDPNESLTVWETPPDGTAPIPLSGLQTDGSGAFSVMVSFPSNGSWQVTAHSIATGKETVNRYSVGAGGGTTSNPAPPPSPSPVVPSPSGSPNVPVASPVAPAAPATGATNSVTASLPQAGVGAAVTFSGNGFNAGESISIWDTAPDSTVAPLSGVFSDGTGGFNTQVSFPSAGIWQITAHGKDSGHEVIGRFNISGDPSTTSTTTSSSFTSPYANSTLKATVGVVVTYTATGYNNGELVSVWSTAPDGTVTPLDSTQATTAGRVTVSTSFGSAGLWQITIHGRDSLHEVIGKYQVAASA